MIVSIFSVPVVITSDRLRSSRIGDNEKPSTSKNEKQEENTYKLSFHKDARNSTTSTTTNKTTNNDNNAREKLYPKRERTKTAKFEEFFTGFTKKGQSEEQVDTAPDNNKAAIELKEENNKADLLENKMKTNEKAILDSSQMENPTNNNNDQSMIQDFELSDTDLTEDITIEMEIIRDLSNKTPPSSLLDSKQSSESDSCESVIEDGERLELIRIPKRIRRYIRQQQQQQQQQRQHLQEKNNPEIDDDIPLSRIFNTSISGQLRLSEDGKVKRPVGRPRKHPIVINKVKRPVGRPRKEPTESHKTANPQQKRKRGRPPSLFVPSQYYDAYAQSSFFDVEDDDERDPVSPLFPFSHLNTIFISMWLNCMRLRSPFSQL